MEQFCENIDKTSYMLYIKEIMEVLTAIHKGKLPNDLSLLNYYMGVPVSYDAEIVEIDRETVFFKVHMNQMIAMSLQKKVLIRSDHLRRNIIADVKYFQKTKQEVGLVNFLYADIMSEKRNFVRVELDPPTEAKICWGARRVMARVVDMSLKSVAAIVDDNSLLLERPAQPKMVLTLTTDNGTMLVDCDVKVIKAIGEPGGRFRYILELLPDKKSEQAISQYIVQQQIRIVRSLKDLQWD